jgi:acetolactate synthase-1/2/3 large subunit
MTPGPLDQAARHGDVADHICDLLALEGVDTVFGVPGGPIMAMFAAIARTPSLRIVNCANEQGAVVAAYGYSVVSGRIGVAVVTSGPGATNALTGLASAHADRVPVLLICGQVARAAVARGAAQDSSCFGVDVVAMARPVTALSCAIMSAAQATAVVPAALRVAVCESRPVMLSIPADVLSDSSTTPGWSLAGYRIGRSERIDLVASERAARALLKSERPAILAGEGARNAGPELQRLAEHLGAPVATTPEGKGAFPEDHPLSLGVFGFAGSPRAKKALLESQVDSLVVFSRLGELASDGWNARLRPANLIQVDIDPLALSGNYPALGVVADARAVVRHWLSLPAVAARRPTDSSWVSALKESTPRMIDPSATQASALPMHPQRALAELQACLPDDAIVVCDIGNTMAEALHGLQIRGRQRFMLNLGLACMGHSVAAALGAHMAEPSAPVVAILGDAAFAMGGFEVHTAVEYADPRRSRGGPVYVVMNNGGNRMVDWGVRAQYGEHSGIDTGVYRHALDVSRIAAGLGASAIRISRPEELGPAVLAGWSPGRGPTVIDLDIDPDAEPPMGERIKTLVGYSQVSG